MSVESQLEVLGAKLAIEFIPKTLAGSGIPEPITRIVLETMIGALQEQQNTSDERLKRLVGSYYQSGMEYLSAADNVDGEQRKAWINQALDKFMTASSVEDDALLAAKSQFFVGVCFDLLKVSTSAREWYERAYTAASQLAAKWLGKPQQLEQLQPFINALSRVLVAHRSKMSVAPIPDQKIRMGWLDKTKLGLKLAGAMTDLESQRYEQALAAFEQLLRLRLNFDFAATIYNNKAVALINLKRYQEALEACEQALRLFPYLAMAYVNKGTSLIELQRYEEGLAASEQALRLNPDLAGARANKKYVLKLLGRNG